MTDHCGAEADDKPYWAAQDLDVLLFADFLRHELHVARRGGGAFDIDILAAGFLATNERLDVLRAGHLFLAAQFLEPALTIERAGACLDCDAARIELGKFTTQLVVHGAGAETQACDAAHLNSQQVLAKSIGFATAK